MTTSLILAAASLVTPLSLASSANFCPVEGSDYFEKDEGNMIKVTVCRLAEIKYNLDLYELFYSFKFQFPITWSIFWLLARCSDQYNINQVGHNNLIL